MTQHTHRTHRSGWLRAGVLGANDGVLSIASLLLGVAAAHVDARGIAITGLAGLVGGALSMGAGEFVSVSTQADTEQADMAIELDALRNDYAAEHAELRDIYVQRGLTLALAHQVAQQLMAHDALGAHARDDIGIADALAARPLQAALASALSFVAGGIVPLLSAILVPAALTTAVVGGLALSFLAALGALAAHAGGASVWRGAARVLVCGTLTMAATSVLGACFGRLL